jgi:uncharacterized membrane protein
MIKVRFVCVDFIKRRAALIGIGSLATGLSFTRFASADGNAIFKHYTSLIVTSTLFNCNLDYPLQVAFNFIIFSHSSTLHTTIIVPCSVCQKSGDSHFPFF